MFSLPSRQLPSQPLPGSQHEQGRGSPALSTRPEADSVLLTSDTLWGLGLGQGWGKMSRRNTGLGGVGVGVGVGGRFPLATAWFLPCSL